MKKGKIFGSAVLSVVIGVSMFATAAFGQTAKQESYRVLIQGPTAEKAKAKINYGMRWDFSDKGFTTTVNAKQYQALLKNKNLKIEKLPELQLNANPDKKAKPGVDAKAVPSDQTPWGIEAIYNDAVIAKTAGGSGIKVAVLDTGVVNHVDLAGNIEQCKDFSQNKSPLIEGSCSDGNGHGTHVSGTVLANGGSNGKGIYGVAPEAKLWAYKVLNNRGSGYSDDIAAAIRKAADEGVLTGSHVIISMSLGSNSKDSLISSAVDYAYSKGVLVVAAAGNDGPNAGTIDYPGALQNVVAVAALENVQENGTLRVADFSSRGNAATAGDYLIQERDVEVSAPGRAVESTWYNGAYNTISGTSMATPHVSGLAAKLWAENKSWSNVQLRTELQNRAKTNDIKGGISAAAGDDIASGYGFPRVK
ncbi:S8 family peptidase [Neobacillus kokaensis]|uniref:Peptidase S8 n=1 Tax=Neobacillus kokaensis TaxID=2759023 RepID=A0ABQ3N123_9BACI|nr:S8 family peptidase [Neobacillus kokaensis]GHH97693.1 peptidase S8 [Neobacillus kokaensis]